MTDQANEAEFPKVLPANMERLQKSKEGYRAGQFEKGRRAGADWAQENAEYCHLRAIAMLDEVDFYTMADVAMAGLKDEPGDYIDGNDIRNFWCDHVETGNPSEPFVVGFVKGVVDVFRAVENAK